MGCKHVKQTVKMNGDYYQCLLAVTCPTKTGNLKDLSLKTLLELMDKQHQRIIRAGLLAKFLMMTTMNRGLWNHLPR